MGQDVDAKVIAAISAGVMAWLAARGLRGGRLLSVERAGESDGDVAGVRVRESGGER